MQPHLRLVEPTLAGIPEPFSVVEARYAALIEGAVAQYLECVLCEVARISRYSDVIGALVLVETAKQELDRIFKALDPTT